MNEREFLEKMQDDILDTETEITMDTQLADVEEWDSLSFVSFIAMAKLATGRKIDLAAIRAAATVRDLFALLA